MVAHAHILHHTIGTVVQLYDDGKCFANRIASQLINSFFRVYNFQWKLIIFRVWTIGLAVLIEYEYTRFEFSCFHFYYGQDTHRSYTNERMFSAPMYLIVNGFAL